jgi:hypothetical protein
MSNVALSGNASGTGTFTIASPNSNTDRTLNLPDASGTLANTDASGNLLVGTTTNTNSSRIVSNGVIESTTGGVRFPDGTTQTTAASAPTTANVLAATAGASADAVGSYAFLGRPFTSGNIGGVTVGGTIAGSVLRFADGNGTLSGTPSGTWRCMGFLSASYDAHSNTSNFIPTLWLRIS